MSDLKVTSLTTFAVAPDGQSVSMHVRDATDKPAVFELPTTCLNELLMTLPQMLTTAMRRQTQDDSLRLVHDVGYFQVERIAGDPRFILTLETSDGFEVSFAIARAHLVDIAEAIATAPVEESATRLM
jgi:hypothetical protein